MERTAERRLASDNAERQLASNNAERQLANGNAERQLADHNLERQLAGNDDSEPEDLPADHVPPVTADAPTSTRLAAADVSLSYDERAVVEGLSLEIPTGRITVIVGPNACGKSTLLRALARLLKPKRGAVLLDGTSIHRLPTKEVATKLGILPQSPVAPEGIAVADLVGRGRYPHQGWFRQWTSADREAVDGAMEATGTLDIAHRLVDELSGGQRQRVWIAMTLAQGTGLLLLDEPTTYLDLAHQVDVLDLLVDLNQREGRTIVLVLHDLNHACRYAHHLVAMREGSIVAEGAPSEIITPELVTQVFGLRCAVIDDPVSGTPMIVPIGRHLNVTTEAADANDTARHDEQSAHDEL